MATFIYLCLYRRYLVVFYVVPVQLAARYSEHALWNIKYRVSSIEIPVDELYSLFTCTPESFQHRTFKISCGQRFRSHVRLVVAAAAVAAAATTAL